MSDDNFSYVLLTKESMTVQMKEQLNLNDVDIDEYQGNQNNNVGFWSLLYLLTWKNFKSQGLTTLMKIVIPVVITLVVGNLAKSYVFIYIL